MSDNEVGPDCLAIDGEAWLAAEVRRDENDAMFEARLAERRQFDANVEAQQRQNSANADFVRDHGRNDRGLLAGGILRRPPHTPA